jgi:hypothetical protein
LPLPATLLASNSLNIAPLLKALAPELSHSPLLNQPDWNSWHLLLAHLKHMAQSGETEPIRQWQSAASIVACNSITRAHTDENALHSALERMMLGESPVPETVSTPTYAASTSENGIFRLLSAVPVTSLQTKCFDAALCALWFDDTGDKPAAEFQQEWQELLRMNNFLQFTPRFVALTQHMVAKGLVSNAISWLLDEEKEHVSKEHESKLTEKQSEELELLDPSLQPVLVPLLKSGSIPWPEFGYEATDEQGRCGTSMIEVAWPLQKIGIALPTNEIKDFEEDGWTILSLESLDSADLETLFNPTA